MSDLQVRAFMAADPALRPRVAIVLTGLAIDVLAEDPIAEGAEMDERTAFARRHEFARKVMADPFGDPASSALAAISSWAASSLSASYLTGGGAAGVQDSDLKWTVTQVWDALAGVN